MKAPKEPTAFNKTIKIINIIKAFIHSDVILGVCIIIIIIIIIIICCVVSVNKSFKTT